MDAHEVVSEARRLGVTLIRFEYCDVSGVARCKAVHVARLADKMREGVNLTRAQMAINLLEQVVHIEGMEPVGEIRLVPDPDTFSVLPWAPASASLLCDQWGHDRRAWGACPRTYLKDVIARATKHGISVRAAFENEYYLAREQDGRYIPVDLSDHAPVYSPIGHDLHADVMVETVDALEAQGMSVEQAINEYGPGQQEISIRHTDALRAADNQMKFRDTVRGVALRHGMLASFAPKPFPEQIGSGAHVHLSLWDADGQRNLLYDPVRRRRAVRTRPALHRRGHRAPAGACCAHQSQLQLLPAARAQRLGRGDDGLGVRQQGGRAAGVLAVLPAGGAELQPRVQDLRPQRQPLPVPRRADRLRPRRHRAGARARGALRARPRPDDRRGARARPGAAAAEVDGRGPGRSWSRTTSCSAAWTTLLARCYLAVRRSEDAAFSAQDQEFEIRHHFYRF